MLGTSEGEGTGTKHQTARAAGVVLERGMPHLVSDLQRRSCSIRVGHGVTRAVARSHHVAPVA